MTIDDLKVPSVLCWESSDICEMTSEQQAFLDLAPEFIALLEGIDSDATYINDGSDPMGGWLGRDEDDTVWAAFIALKKKLEKM